MDLTPPHPGQVHDGVSGSPEVDYQARTQLHAHWSGFFDRESGVKFYQYAFHTSCLEASAFAFDTTDTRVGAATFLSRHLPPPPSRAGQGRA